MLPKCVRITYGNVATDVRVTQLDTISAAFIGTPAMAARFARMSFKLGEQWFDVEGVVVARWTGSGACPCELRFSAMTNQERDRLKLALRPPERDLSPPRQPPSLLRPNLRAAPGGDSDLPTYSKRDVQEIIREAMESLAV